MNNKIRTLRCRAVLKNKPYPARTRHRLSPARGNNARIRRASDQPRNPGNRATEPELTHIHQAKNAMAEGKPVKPQLLRDQGKVTAYYPIMTDAFCLQCHGTPGADITEETMAKIQELYPKDEATGYAAETLRGIWVVEMRE